MAAAWDLQKFDYAAFREKFVQLKTETTYAKCMKNAEQVKASKWDHYKHNYERLYGVPYRPQLN